MPSASSPAATRSNSIPDTIRTTTSAWTSSASTRTQTRTCVTYVLNDGGALLTESLGVAGTPYDNVPTEIAIPDQVGIAGQQVSFDAGAAFDDVDADVANAPGSTAPNYDALTYFVVGTLPAGLHLNASTGVISGSVALASLPNPASANTYDITINARDKAGNSVVDPYTFEWIVPPRHSQELRQPEPGSFRSEPRPSVEAVGLSRRRSAAAVRVRRFGGQPRHHRHRRRPEQRRQPVDHGRRHVLHLRHRQQRLRDRQRRQLHLHARLRLRPSARRRHRHSEPRLPGAACRHARCADRADHDRVADAADHRRRARQCSHHDADRADLQPAGRHRLARLRRELAFNPTPTTATS